MKSAMDAFTGGIRPGMTALFYFSGYGIQVARQTYLIPVNAQLWTEGDVRQDGISLDDVVADIHRKGAKVKLVIIDAARRDPYERRFRAVAAGLAPIDAPENTLAIFSAAPGKLVNDGTGTSSLFIGELVKQLRAPKVAAEEIFNRVRVGVARASNNAQIPWIFSSLLEPFYFGSPPPLVTTDHATSLSSTAPSGVKTDVAEHSAYNRSCEAQRVKATITTQPANGTATTTIETKTVPQTGRLGGPQSCARKSMPTAVVYYQSKPDFKGTDQFKYQRINQDNPNDRLNGEVVLTVTVK